MNIKDYKKLLKNKNNQLFAVILIIGAVMIFASGFEHKTPTSSGISEEVRLEKILSDIKGAGEVSVMITYHIPEKNKNSEIKKAKGAVITAGGCLDPAIKAALSEAACAALDLPAHKVCVYLKEINRKD